MIYPKIYDRLLKRTQSVQDAFPRRAWERSRFIGEKIGKNRDVYDFMLYFNKKFDI